METELIKPSVCDLEQVAISQQIAQYTPQKSPFADDLLRATKENTRRMYSSALRMFTLSGYPFPASSPQVAEYVCTACAWQEDHVGAWVKTHTPLSPNSLNLHVAAISFAHRLAGLDDPTKSLEVTMALKAIKQERGTDPSRQAKPLLKADIQAMLDVLEMEIQTQPEKRLTAMRDAALIMIGFSGAFRRSELVNLSLPDITFKPGEGVLIRLKRSKKKTGSFTKAIYYGQGRYCPVKILDRWLLEADLRWQHEQGREVRVFRGIKRGGELRETLHPNSVNNIVKARAEQADIDLFQQHGAMSTRLDVSAHSLRAGFITELRKQGIQDWKIARITGHKDLRVLDIYNREGELFKDNPTLGLW